MTEGQGMAAAAAHDLGGEGPGPGHAHQAAPTKASPAGAQPAAPDAKGSPAAAASPAPVAGRSPGAGPPSVAGPVPSTAQARAAAAARIQAATQASGLQPVGVEEEAELDALVDARLIQSAIMGLRKPILAASLPLEAPGVEQARAERVKLLSQIDDYLLPRLRESGAPILVALVGSTGAGKSTLVNSVVGTKVSMTGIRRPTTNSPVLACHPDEVGWFAENVFLPTVPRVRQEGLARAGRDGLLVLAADAGMPKGVALLDTPDIDSVVKAHHEFAHQFLDASDLWLFMTTASRYADAAVWELLQHARDRNAALSLVLSRIPPSAEPEVVEHFDAMLEANGLGGHERFLVPETVLIDGMLPPEISGPAREWLAAVASRADSRVAVLTKTMSGVLDTFLTRIPALAAEVEAQAKLRTDLTRAVAGSYRAAMADLDREMRGGSLMSGEALAQWQHFAGTGDLVRALNPKGKGRKSRRRHRGPAKVHGLKMAVRTALEAAIAALADRAAEASVARWREHPTGSALLDQLADPSSHEGWKAAGFAVEAGLVGLEGWPYAPGPSAEPGTGEPAPSQDGEGRPDEDEPGTTGQGQTGKEDKKAATAPSAEAALGRASTELATRVARAVSSWQDQVAWEVQAENATKKATGRDISLDDDPLAAVLVVGLLVPAEGATGTLAIPHRLLTSWFGADQLRDIMAWARADLRDRVSLIFDEEMRRFAAVIDAAGTPDVGAAVQLYQATYALEVTR